MTHIPGASTIHRLTRNTTSNETCKTCKGGRMFKGGTVWINDHSPHGLLGACPHCEQGKIIAESQTNTRNQIHYPKPTDTYC